MLAVLFATPMAAGITVAAAAAIPVVIHLLNRRRYRIVDWAAMRFLLAAQRQNVRRLRLEQWFLLAVRCAILVLLAVALAAVTPWAEAFWQRWFPGSGLAAPALTGRTHKVLVVDGSLSMTLRGKGGTAFERARSQAAELVRSSAGGDGFSVILIGAPVQAIVPGPAEDAGKVAAEIEALRCSHGPADLAGALHLADELIRRAPGKYAQREIYLFSDLQKATWPPPASPSGAWTEPWSRLQAQAQLAVIDVGLDGAENLAVTDLAIADPLIVAGSRTLVTATIHNYSLRDRADLRVELLMGRDAASPTVVQQQTVSIAAGGAASAPFAVEFSTPGDYLIQARVPGDDLEADDIRSLNIRVRDSLPVLLVNGKPDSYRREQAASWLADALNPFTDGLRRAAYPVMPKTIDLAQFADPAAGDLSAFEAVFLCDVPRLTEREAERLDAHLQRGGGVVIALGPTVDLENYNRILGRDGRGLLPGKLTSLVRAPGDKFFTLTADNEAFQRPPLAAFAADNDRAALVSARFRQYVRVEPSAASGARKILRFVPPAGMPEETNRQILADPLVVERSRHRGRVVLISSSVNADWTSWPIAPSFPPFMQELTRFTVRSGPRRTIHVGEPIDEFLPATVAAGQATIRTPDGRSETTLLQAEPNATRLHFDGADQSGLYRITTADQARPIVFAVNVPANAESDLQRLTSDELRSMTPDEDVQIVTDPAKVHRSPKRLATEPAANQSPAPAVARGPGLARVLLEAMFVLLVVECFLAWRFGAARSGSNGGVERTTTGGRILDAFGIVATVALIVIAIAAGSVLIHAALSNDFLGFLPAGVRARMEAAFGVPPAIPGEGTRWRLEFLPFLTGQPNADRWLVGIVGAAAIGFAIFLYRREIRRPRRAAAIVPPAALRIALYGLALTVLLPQVQLLFEREGWPDLVVLIDDSKSMSHIDDYRDDVVRAKLTELGVDSSRRLSLVQSLLSRNNAAWLNALLAGRQIKLHLYRCSDRLERIDDLEGGSDRAGAVAAIARLTPDGGASRLGTAVESILQEFRGSALAGIVVFTDGVNTDGDDLVVAAQHAAHAGVPLYPIGVGDAHEPRDLVLHDLQVDDAVHVQDRLVFEARVTARGGLRATSVPATLLERVPATEGGGETWKPIKRESVALDPSGKPVRVRLTHAPTQPGERRYAIDVPVQADETDPTNNRLERTVFVAEAQRTRILYIEGYPRYEFRFLKALLERESDAIRGNKTIDLAVMLADADPDYSKEDRSALDALPATREELFRQYDLVILGDIDPRHPKFGEKHMQWLADFVKEKGGGLLFIAGSQFLPAAYRDTPLADVIPVELADGRVGHSADSSNPYRLRLSPIGQMHPLFRLAADDADNQAIWERLMPMYWSAGALKLKPAAELLAVKPSAAGLPGEPLAVQQFVGAGRVLFFGFDESWRWRRREDERLYNQFWIQAVRYLARTRLGRCDLRLDRQTPYRNGEPIRVLVRFPDDMPPPRSDVPVQVTIEATPLGRTAVETQTLRLAKLEGSRATFEGLLARTTPGEYRFRLASPAQAGPPPEARARVLPPPGELDELRMNRSDLERAALVSRGQFFTIAEADRLPESLPELPRVALHQPRPPYKLWSHPAVFAFALGLIGFEWLLRKRRHLL